MPIIDADPRDFACAICKLPVADHTGPPKYTGGGEYQCPIKIEARKMNCITIEVNASE